MHHLRLVEDSSPIVLHDPRKGTLWQLTIAFEQATGADEWGSGDFSSCRFASIDTDRALLIEASGQTLAVTLSNLTTMQTLQAWRVVLCDELFRAIEVRNGLDAHDAPASDADIAALSDTLWQFHRLAVEDRASMVRKRR